MEDTAEVQLLADLWGRQSVWSQAANRARDRIAAARRVSLLLIVAAAVLAAAAPVVAGFSGPAGRVVALITGVTLGLVPVVRRRLATEHLQAWVRLRALSESLKAEVYTYLAGVRPYRGSDRTANLDARTSALLDEAEDLLPHAAGLVPAARPVPAATGVSEYRRSRVADQIDTYYLPRADAAARNARRISLIETVLAASAVVLGAVAAVYGTALAPWIGVAGTVSGAVIAHASSARYAFLDLEYRRTAQRLDVLTRRFAGTAGGTDAEDVYVAECERLISIQNDGWMVEQLKDRPNGSGTGFS